jgi:hypothetical protein
MPSLEDVTVFCVSDSLFEEFKAPAQVTNQEEIDEEQRKVESANLNLLGRNILIPFF